MYISSNSECKLRITICW